MNCEVKPESGQLAGKVHCNFICMNDKWPKDVCSSQGRTWKNVHAVHLSSHQWSCMGIDIVWCGLKKLYFNSEVLVIHWGIRQISPRDSLDGWCTGTTCVIFFHAASLAHCTKTSSSRGKKVLRVPGRLSCSLLIKSWINCWQKGSQIYCCGP